MTPDTEHPGAKVLREITESFPWHEIRDSVQEEDIRQIADYVAELKRLCEEKEAVIAATQDAGRHAADEAYERALHEVHNVDIDTGDPNMYHVVEFVRSAISRAIGALKSE